MNFLQPLLPAIEHFHTFGYWLAFLVALLETTIGIGIFIPGSIGILFLGTLAARGYFDLGDLFWFVIIGAVIGDNINYFIGQKYGRKIFTNGWWFIKPEHFKKGADFFERHATKSVFFGRFVPSLKEVMPLVAGTFGMKRLPFMIWNILGAIGWSLVWILPGYFFFKFFEITQLWMSRAEFILLLLVCLLVVFYIFKVIIVRKGKKVFLFLGSIWHSIRIAVIHNEEVKKFIAKHEGLFLFLRRRLDKSNFFGLPLTLFGFVLLYIIFLFGGIVNGMINSATIVAADIRIENLIAIFRSVELTHFFWWITLLGIWQIVGIFALATALILWIVKKRVYILPLFLTVIGSQSFVYIGKLIFQRVRPETALYWENSFSFPSGHATIAVAFYGFIAYLIIRNTSKWNYRVNTFFICLLVILFIGFSRLYLGVHYLSDVWGGYLAGAIWLVLAISLAEYFLSKSKIVEARRNLEQHLSIVIGFLALGFYVIFALNYPLPLLVKDSQSSQNEIMDLLAIFSTEQLRYTETLVGSRQEPLSFMVITKDEQALVNIFEQAGWVAADEVTLTNILKLVDASVLKKSYDAAPMTPDFWNAKVHDFGFEKAVEINDVSKRHHARFWKTGYQTTTGDEIYVGTASFDNGLKWKVTHIISPDIDTEREFLLADLKDTELITNIEKVQFVEPILGSNFSGDAFFTDGKIYIVTSRDLNNK
ncbi:MAG: LssY C-terminal domain-containing protein [Candidatus Komeilibacteria bacterium]